MFNIQSHHKATGVQDAIRLLRENSNARLIAGGTDVLVKLHKGKEGFEQLVDIHDLPELNTISQIDNGDLVIGPGCCFTRVAESELIRTHVPILAQAVLTIGGPQVRNMGTIGGNICNGVPSADSATPLFALNAVLTIENAEGRHQLPIEDFFLGPGKVALQQDEVLTAITITRDNFADHGGCFYKYAMRGAMDIATIGCSAVCFLDHDRIQDLRLAFGVAAPVPIRCKQTENQVRGRRISQDLLNEIGSMVIDDVRPRTSWRASKEFRLQIITELARRVVLQAIINAGGSFS